MGNTDHMTKESKYKKVHLKSYIKIYKLKSLYIQHYSIPGIRSHHVLGNVTTRSSKNKMQELKRFGAFIFSTKSRNYPEGNHSCEDEDAGTRTLASSACN